ncbi:hypothetical protein QQF64_030861 [Cirrhinus molitorella]|uniref:LRRNT domain-containing protein n=1 Tax=Cirrhinus molitorella TaxID=172907 RepID=A0ABR3N4J3_9TELE
MKSSCEKCSLHNIICFTYRIGDQITSPTSYDVPRRAHSYVANAFRHLTLISSSAIFIIITILISPGRRRAVLDPKVMDVWFCSAVPVFTWRLLFLSSIFQGYWSSMLDCPLTCSCSPVEIYCNKSDSGNFFPLLALQDPASNGTNNNDIEELFRNITSM